MPNEEIQNILDDLTKRVKDLEGEKEPKHFEDIKQHAQLKVLKLYAGLPVFTSTPDYTGFEGEFIWVNDGTHYYLYAYINGGWRYIGSTDLTDGNATTAHKHDHGALDGLADDDHASYLSTDAIFGDGSDGDVTISSDTTLTADMFYNDLTINTTKKIIAAGYRIYVKGTLTLTGDISRDGVAGGDGAPGVPGTGGAALATTNLGGSGAGGDGVKENPGNAGANVINSIGGAGGKGGDNTFAGGDGGTVTAPDFLGIRAMPFASMLTDFPSADLLTGGAGAGGGAGDGVGAGTGGGGSGGGVLFVAAHTITGSGTISANGGKGGDANGTGNFGGGGGGGGGAVILIYKTKSGNETISANGGALGTKNDAGGDGVAGDAGTVIILQI